MNDKEQGHYVILRSVLEKKAVKRVSSMKMIDFQSSDLQLVDLYFQIFSFRTDCAVFGTNIRSWKLYILWAHIVCRPELSLSYSKGRWIRMSSLTYGCRFGF